MRTITISTDTFAAIWSHRQLGEETEDAILRRMLSIPKAPEIAVTNGGREGIGFTDARNNVELKEGFEIFRIYKGKEYRARATNGKLLLFNNNAAYSSLHKLSQAVVHGNENSWYNWKYMRSDGTEAFIHSLRDPSKVPTRD